MIGYLKGFCHDKEEGSIILMVGGVGYLVEVTNVVWKTAELDCELEIWISTYVKEDALKLYGFSNKQERKLFELLLRISGIGPRLGVAILSTLCFQELIFSIQNDQVSQLESVPGIGKRMAKKIIIDLKEKLNKLNFLSFIQPIRNKQEEKQENSKKHHDFMQALAALGYKNHEIKNALQIFSPQDFLEQDLSNLIKTAVTSFHAGPRPIDKFTSKEN